MKTIKRIMAALICIMIALTGIPFSVKAADSSGSMSTEMETNSELFITLEENKDYRWNVNDDAGKSSVVHLDTSEGNNCRFRLDHIEKEWYGIKHIKVNGTDRFVDVDGKSKDSGAVLHVWESSDSEVKGNDHRQFAFYYIGDDENGNARYYIKNRKSGKWIGYEGKLNNNNPKIIQTDEKNRKVWLITKSVVPITGKESQVLKEEDTSAICEIHVAGKLDALNRASNLAAPGSCPTFQVMGITSKWKLKWIPEYHAYQIDAVSDGESTTNLSLDVEGESGKLNASVNIWTTEKFDRNQNTSQLWRFFKQKDGTYKIQNARTGWYIENRVPSLVFGKNGMNVELSILAGNTAETAYSYANEWMAGIPDEALLSSVNIPATHDTGTAGVVEDLVPSVSITSCQNLYYDEQLNMGARSFDIRANATKDDASAADVKIVHGGELWQCQEKNGSDLTLQSILNTSLGFLEKHKSETVILTVKPDAGSTIGLEHAVAEFIEKNKDKVYSGGDIPSMKEARGKIIFLRRFNLTKNYDSSVERAMGFNLTNWDDIKYKDYKYAYKLYDDGKNHVYIQDAYNTYGSEKWPYILETMKQTTGQDTSHPIEYNSWVFNYTSCSQGAPLGLTQEINPRLFKDEDNCIDNRFLGTVMLNFIDEPMSRLIYETNSNMIFEPKLPTPEVEVEYGQTLAEATLKGIENAPAGTWKFEDAAHVVTDQEVADQTKFELTFLPADNKKYKTVTMWVPVKTVNKSEVITAYLGYEEISYGETPKMSYVVAPTETLSADEVEALFANVTDEMRIQETGQSLNEIIDAGSYKIDCPETVGGFKVNWIHLKEYDLDINPVNTMETTGSKSSTAENTTFENGAVSSAQRIIVRAEKKTKTYGDELTSADLTFTISDSERAKLLPGDTVESLGLTLKATTIEPEDILTGSTTDADGDDILGAYGNAGRYVILKDNATNTNYDVVVLPAFLNVSPKEAEIEWNAAAQYTYTGNACGIEANVKADSLLEKDSCAIKKLLNADHTEVGNYKALAIGLTNENYIFSGTNRVHIWEYEILQADPEVTFPAAEVIYGDSLKKATLFGQSGEGVFRFADDTTMLTVAENQSEQEMIFTPANPNYKTVTSNIPVTVKPRSITIRPDRTEKEYGQTITEYTWSISDGSLAGDDQIEDLKINVTLTVGDAEKETCEVGTYEITEKAPTTVENQNYAVTFEPGILIVQPKPVDVVWNTDGTIIYTGKEVNVTAELSGVLFKDECKAVVEDGNAVEPGKYTASIVGLTGEQCYNYVLHGEDTDYQIEYQIVKKEETKNPTDSKETSTGTAGKKPTGTSASGKQVKTAKTGDSISYLWILMIAGSIAVIGGMIYVIRRRKKK
ncbi:MAG: LPXTG cell wall anchor domain-containing protein [[Ruminococcus] faecis]|nr:LPXTG cell wall anchor domain-containing protein [Mediterraneibacter faecis]